MTKASVCMATYNGAKYIKEQIDSILKQEFKENNDVELELIISDDGSTDDTLKIVESYNDSRIKIFHHLDKPDVKYNKAAFCCTQNFGHAMSKATGDYIFLSDQDDIWYPHKMDKSISLLKSVNKGVVATAFEIGNEDLSYTYSTYRYIREGRFQLIRKYKMYGFSGAFTRNMLNLFLPMPQIPYHDNFMTYIASFMNKLYFIDDSCAIHRWSGEHNVSSIGNQQPNIVRTWYRVKMLYYVIWRIVRNKIIKS